MVVKVSNLENKIKQSEIIQTKFLEKGIDKYINENYGLGKSLVYQWPTNISENVEKKIIEMYSNEGWNVEKVYGMIYDVDYAWKFTPKYNQKENKNYNENKIKEMKGVA